MSVTAVPIQPLKRGSVLKLWLGLLALALAAAALAWFGADALRPITTASGVKMRVIKEGTGAKITPADAVAFHYKLRVGTEDGAVIQDSQEGGQPFVTSVDGVYPGVGEGLQMMRQGGRYTLWVPPGQHVQGPLPPGTPFKAGDTLVFDIEVMQVAAGMAQVLKMQQQEQMRRQLEALQPPPGEGGEGGQGGEGSGDGRTGSGKER